MPAKKYATNEERTEARRRQRRAWFETNRALEYERRAARRAADRTIERLGSARYDAEHREERASKARARRAADPEAARHRQRAWRADNIEKAREATRRWQQENPGWNRVHAARRAGAKAAGTLTAVQWRGLLEEFDHRCAYCQAPDVKLEQEHVTPLSRGGRHDIDNVVPSCRSCNSRKGRRDLFEFVGMVT